MASQSASSSSSAGKTTTQYGSNSVEYLLKKAYATHRSQVKELEHQLEAIRISKKPESLAKCSRCEELETSLYQLKNEFDIQLKEKNKRIEDLEFQLENAKVFEIDEADSLVLETEMPSKRKRRVHWTPLGTSYETSGVCSKSNSKLSVPQRDVVLVPETMSDSPFGFDGKQSNIANDQSFDMFVQETLPEDIECLSKVAEIKVEDVSSERVDGIVSACSIAGEVSPSRSPVVASNKKTVFHFDTTPRKRYRRRKYKQTTLTQNASLFTTADLSSKSEEILVTVEPAKNGIVLDSPPLNEHKRERDDDADKTDYDAPIQLERNSSPFEQLSQLQEESQRSSDETFIPSPYLRKLNNGVDGQRAPARPLTQDDPTPSPDLLFHDDVYFPAQAVSDSDSTCSEDMLHMAHGMTSSTKYGSTIRPEQEESAISKKPPETDDFDKVPSKPSPPFKYKRETVRRQEDRRKLDGHDCRDCEEYFRAMDLTDEEKRERLKFCSRHRDKHAAPQTPDHFWSIRFPTTQECKERGILESTQIRPLVTRRRRLQLP